MRSGFGSRTNGQCYLLTLSGSDCCHEDSNRHSEDQHHVPSQPARTKQETDETQTRTVNTSKLQYGSKERYLHGRTCAGSRIP